jgi:hypothetical protein
MRRIALDSPWIALRGLEGDSGDKMAVEFVSQMALVNPPAEGI